MKKTVYSAPNAELLKVSSEDVIATSNGNGDVDIGGGDIGGWEDGGSFEGGFEV